VGFLLGFVASDHVRIEPVWRALEVTNTDSAALDQSSEQLSADETQSLQNCAPCGAASYKPAETIQDEMIDSTHTVWSDRQYCWVVICKNHWFHHHPNTFNVHRIPLGETDTVAPRPPIQKPFAVRCDECSKEYTYKPSEVLRYEMDAPSAFVPHPLFREQL